MAHLVGFIICCAAVALMAIIHNQFLQKKLHNARKEIENAERKTQLQIELIRKEEEKLRAEVKAADKVRRDFVANASHELRTPLTAIRGFAETLLDGAVHDTQLAKRFLQTILDNAVRLDRLVADLLELSRSESPESGFNLEPVDCVAIVRRVSRNFEAKAAEKAISLLMRCSEQHALVLVDERALEHVISNLLDNAIKYTDQGGGVVMSIRRDEYTTIEVTDTGHGIDENKLPRVFERFYRVDKGRARDVGGTGLGLAIVKHLVQRMNGSVTVDSTIGEGSTFRVSFPSA